VTPLSLGIETLGGVMTKLIERNTTIPTEKTETFSTAADNQTSVEIHVLQGEREFAKDNRTLGRFQLTGIATAPRGLPQIEVKFQIDANGILNVSATDRATNKTQRIEIEKGASGLSDAEIEQMRKDAEEHAAEDRQRRELVDARNQADNMIHQVRQQLEEHGDKVGAEVRGKIESAVNDLETKVKQDDAEAIKRSMEAVQKATMEMGKAVYESQSRTDGGAAGGEAGGEAEGAAKDEDVIDAEYEVKE
jgi:molecular chaperone DnaK